MGEGGSSVFFICLDNLRGDEQAIVMIREFTGINLRRMGYLFTSLDSYTMRGSHAKLQLQKLKR